MNVESPTVDEADEIADLWVALARDQRRHGSHLQDEGNYVAIRESIVRHITGDTLLVARDGDEIRGFVMYALESGAYEQTVTRGLIQNLYVEPGVRDQGIGASLLRAAEERLAEMGASVVGLEVMAANEDARRFYRRRGYEPHRVELERSLESDTL